MCYLEKWCPLHHFFFFCIYYAMNEKDMEALARAYNMELRGAESPTTQAVLDILNEQIYLLTRLSYARNIVGYVISLKECVKELLQGIKKPSRRVLPREGGANRILNLEFELLTILDELSVPNLQKILEYENRALCLICHLVK